MCNRLLRLCLALFIGCLAGAPVFGQVSTGQLSGTVTDPSGAVVSGATVTVIQKGTGTTRTVTTGDAGTYTVPLLPPGTYRVEVTAPNFRKTVLDDVPVRITENTTVDLTLHVGDVSGEVVVVTAERPLVRTDSSSHGRVIEERSLRQLPLPTRNFPAASDAQRRHLGQHHQHVRSRTRRHGHQRQRPAHNEQLGAHQRD